MKQTKNQFDIIWKPDFGKRHPAKQTQLIPQQDALYCDDLNGNNPIGSCIWTLGSQLVALFRRGLRD